MNHILNHCFKPFDDNPIQPVAETFNYKPSRSRVSAQCDWFLEEGGITTKLTVLSSRYKPRYFRKKAMLSLHNSD